MLKPPIGPAVFDALRDLHRQIRDHAAKRSAGHPERANDVKLSRGGIRGFNQQLSPRVLVLINNRQAYVDALGANLFAYFPIGVEDIERIEIIRGPASALYGANGFSGIINIITVAPGDRAETGVTIGGGMGSSLRAGAWSSGRAGRISYRLSAGYDQFDHSQSICVKKCV